MSCPPHLGDGCHTGQLVSLRQELSFLHPLPAEGCPDLLQLLFGVQRFQVATHILRHLSSLLVASRVGFIRSDSRDGETEEVGGMLLCLPLMLPSLPKLQVCHLRDCCVFCHSGPSVWV